MYLCLDYYRQIGLMTDIIKTHFGFKTTQLAESTKTALIS
jgi:hypothetical protein